jgi:hypothetical protein
VVWISGGFVLRRNFPEPSWLGILRNHNDEVAMDIDALMNDFAIRSFRDQADEDYIAARMAFRARLVTPTLWQSHQAVEKYLKCILLLNRIPAKRVWHDLKAALHTIKSSGKVVVDLTKITTDFITYLDTFGKFRYLEISTFASGTDLVTLDRTAWELRRYCTLSTQLHKLVLQNGALPPNVRIVGGYLEKVLDDNASPAREQLSWRNAFFGRRRRRRVPVANWSKMTNAPLYLNPQIMDEVLKYVYLPKEVIDGYRLHCKP